MSSTDLYFGPFHLDPTNVCVWHGQERLALQPKEFAVLWYLARHPSRLVTPEELLSTLWAGTVVSPGVLKVRLRRIRQALGDQVDTPRFIETVQRQGYRFIAPVAAGDAPPRGSEVRDSPVTFPHAVLHPRHAVEFIGRDRELAELRTHLEDAVHGQGRTTVLTGEPGIGKTRTADELAQYARSQMIPVLTGHCAAGEGPPPLWPWTQVMRGYVSLVSLQQLHLDLGKGAADIAQAIPEMQAYCPQFHPVVATEPALARFRFLESFTTFLRHATRRQPLVIILEDIHWADASSLLLLQFIAQELRDTRLFLVVTCRDGEGGQRPQLAMTLGELARVQGSQSLALPPFTQDEVARFLVLTTARTPSPALVSAVYRRTEGNPFFVTEVVGQLAQVPADDVEAPPFVATGEPLPQRVRDAIALRLCSLSAPCRHLLTVASALGLEFHRPVLEAIGARGQPALTQPQVGDLLSEAETAHFIVMDPHHLGRYRFSHALVRETLYVSLESHHRARVHRQIGETLEREALNNASPPISELAFHFFQAATESEVEKAIAYSIQAAEYATGTLGYEEAVEHYARVVQLLTLRPNEWQRCETLLAMGEAQRRAGAMDAARESFHHASDLARQLPAPELLARAALGFAPGFTGISVSGGIEDPLVVALLEGALRQLEPGDSPLRARVLGRLAMELYWSGSQEQRDSLSQHAVEIARRLNDLAALAYTLNARQVTLWGPDTAQERIAGAEEMITLAKRSGNGELLLRGQIQLMTALMERGDLQRADREFMTYVKRAEDLRQPEYLWFSATWQGMRCWLRGEFAASERWAREAFRIGERARDPDAAQCYLVQISSFRGAVKSLHDIELPTKDFAERMVTIPSWRAGLALLYVGLQQDALARQEFEQVVAGNFIDIPRDANWMIAMTNLAQVSAYLRDSARSTRIYELLLPYADRCLVVGAALLCLGSLAWYLGILATALARWEEAETHFETALRRNIQLGAKPMIVQTKQRHAMMLLARKHPGDTHRALTLLEEALTMSQRIDMELTSQHIVSLREQTLQALQTRLSSAPAGTRPKLARQRSSD
ncbi:MAG: AAA family ATPase [Deltaproteobacteria bacterium]|nr:AAA family ATPase [Deltaproteobacteria bacterium]